MSNADRRREPRFETHLEGLVRRKSADEVVCRIANLSRSGALAVSSRPLPEMTQVRIRIQVDCDDLAKTEGTFNCQAAVVRCDRRPDGAFDLGLFFTAMEPSDRAILEEILKAKPLVTG